MVPNGGQTDADAAFPRAHILQWHAPEYFSAHHGCQLRLHQGGQISGHRLLCAAGDEVIPVHTDYRVATAQIVSFALPPEPPTDVQPEPLPIDVIYEDEFAAVLNKPAGIAVHPTLNHTSGTLANGWLYRLKCRGEDGVFRPVNRIDKNTSGLVLCAQNAFAAPELAKTAQKCYLALVEGPLPVGSGRIDVPIARRGDSIIGRCVREDGKPSVTEYTVLAASASHALVSVFR